MAGDRAGYVGQGHGFFVYVRRVKSGYRSYLSPQDSTDFAEDLIRELFQSSSHPSAHGKMSGYDIATFSGKLAKAPHADSDCFEFLRYGGVINAPGGFSGAPGYANGIYGGYCQKGGTGVSDSTIQHVLIELQAPVD